MRSIAKMKKTSFSPDIQIREIAINALIAYGGWVPKNMGGWNC